MIEDNESLNAKIRELEIKPELTIGDLLNYIDYLSNYYNLEEIKKAPILIHDFLTHEPFHVRISSDFGYEYEESGSSLFLAFGQMNGRHEKNYDEILSGVVTSINNMYPQNSVYEVKYSGEPDNTEATVNDLNLYIPQK